MIKKMILLCTVCMMIFSNLTTAKAMIEMDWKLDTWEICDPKKRLVKNGDFENEYMSEVLGKSFVENCDEFWEIWITGWLSLSELWAFRVSRVELSLPMEGIWIINERPTVQSFDMPNYEAIQTGNDDHLRMGVHLFVDRSIYCEEQLQSILEKLQFTVTVYFYNFIEKPTEKAERTYDLTAEDIKKRQFVNSNEATVELFECAPYDITDEEWEWPAFGYDEISVWTISGIMHNKPEEHIYFSINRITNIQSLAVTDSNLETLFINEDGTFSFYVILLGEGYGNPETPEKIVQELLHDEMKFFFSYEPYMFTRGDGYLSGPWYEMPASWSFSGEA